MNSPVPAPPDVQPAPEAGAVVTEELAAVKRKVLDRDPEFRYFEQTSSLAKRNGLVNCLISTDGESHDPDVAFDRLRWGGQYVCVSSRKPDITALPEKFSEVGFLVERDPAYVRTEWGLPLISPKAHYFVARKTTLVRPREFSDRFTYHVQLERRENAHAEGPPGTEHWVVRKEVPAYDRILTRLRAKAPDLPLTTLERRAKKFSEQIFPLFLTREAAMLKIIERDCPREFLHHFPRVVDLEKDENGYVQRMWTTWLRNGGRTLSQLEFARQAAELVHILHDRIGIIHLDLRMDNLVITEHGVGFVDFGSAVRVNENIHGNAVLSTLFGELMRTSQIQRMLDRMSTAGSVTSRIIREAYQRVDKAVDLFYLAVQISQPTANPDIRELIKFEKFSPDAVGLAGLTEAILRPPNPNQPRFKTARDVRDEILRIEADVKSGKYDQTAVAEASKPRVWIWK
jgi:tRNA A-37 threonylcarbamoyl transferase component Bud32